MDWQDRADRLETFLDSYHYEPHKLLYGHEIPDTLFLSLQSAVAGYLSHCVAQQYKLDQYEIYDMETFLETENCLVQLSNRTPNGVVLPQRESALWFNLIHSSVVDILEKFHADKYAEAVHLPLIIRVVSGEPDSVVDNRPYATAKLHIDAWNGEPPSAFSIFIPVLGDVANTGVEFFEVPAQHLGPLIRQFPDYQHGADSLDTTLLQPYHVTWQQGSLYVADPLLLHKTMKRGGGIRVSIDFRLIPKQSLPSDVPVTGAEGVSNWKRNFVPWDEWRKIGKSVLAVPKDTFTETKARKEAFLKHGTPIPSIDYTTYFDMIKI